MELGRTCFEFTRLKKDGSPHFTSVHQRSIETPERAPHRHGARGGRLSINISNERPLRTEGHGFAVLPCEGEDEGTHRPLHCVLVRRFSRQRPRITLAPKRGRLSQHPKKWYLILHFMSDSSESFT